MPKKAISIEDLNLSSEEIQVCHEDLGVMIWVFTPDTTSELRTLHERAKNQRLSTIGKRMWFAMLIAHGMLRNPELEEAIGRELDRSLAAIAEKMTDLIKQPPKAH